MKPLIPTFLLIAGTVANAQTLQIAQPVERAVFQRHANNLGEVPVTVTLTNGHADLIEARAVNRQTQLPVKDWIKVGTGTKLTLPAGWYRLELRAKNAGNVVATGAVEHVGVGEVFVTCGQSNSANHGKPPQKAQDDRVSSCNSANGLWKHGDDPQPGASGKGGSPWALLGDLLAKKYDMPVGFICVGIGGSPLSLWTPRGRGYPQLKRALQLAGPQGVRAVLWHQGESDSILGTSADNYARMLESCIVESRKDAGWPVPWGVALVSFHPDPKATAERQAAIVAGQKKVITTVPGVFQGPATDSFHTRGWLSDSVHFNAQGLAAHAQGWAEALAPVIGKKAEIKQ
jgi:eukaryotic-like serine/threonine-protein kinase